MAQDDVPVIHSGTTAVVAVLVGNKMTIASVGDSRAVLGRKDGTAKDLTVDQNPDHPLEMPRILKAGGFVKKGVDGLSSRVYLNKELTMVGLAMARSLGDRCVKHVGVIAEPAVVEYAVDEAEDAFIIVASDGIWEFVPSQYALILEGAARWSEEEGDYRDDITCMVLKVNPLTFLTKEGAAYLPAAADDRAGARTAGAAEKTSNLKMPKGRNTVMLDTKGTGVVDTVGVDTVGDGIADTFYPAKAVDSTGSGQVDAVEVDTNDPRKASNMYGGQSGARASQKAAFASKQDMLAKLVAKVDEDEDVASRASDDFSFAD
ncbi:protein serine/threonine phosphatase [Aureococcus anophagefferens]|nr:protein serine/threonine phosphatase [Aureococcus anophagefferens]